MGKKTVLLFTVCALMLLYALLQPTALLAAPVLLVAAIHMPAMRRARMAPIKRRERQLAGPGHAARAAFGRRARDTLPLPPPSPPPKGERAKAVSSL